MHERTLQAFIDELEKIQGVEKVAMAKLPSGKNIRKFLLRGTRPLRNTVHLVEKKFDDVARDVYVKRTPRIAKKGLEVAEDLMNMGPPGPKGRHG